MRTHKIAAQAKVRKYHPHKPDRAAGWKIAKQNIEGGWTLYVNDMFPGWANLKLVSDMPRERKANYFISWSLETQRWGKSKDVITLRTFEPELYQTVQTVILDRYYGGDPWNM